MALNHACLSMKEYHKAKRLHWDPQAIDFTADHADWARLNERDRAGTLQLCSLFLLGEEAVTQDLAPLIIALRSRGDHTEDNIFLATQLYEEARHSEFFDRWLAEVPGQETVDSALLTPSYQALFMERLPERLNRCMAEPSTLHIAQATATYHLLIEGVMAETGYYIFSKAMEARNLFPGLLAGVNKIRQDEGRHIAFGLHLIRTLVREEPAILPDLLASLDEGLVLATGSLAEAFDHWGDNIPFDLSPNEAIEYAAHQFSKRLAAIQRESHQA